MSEPGYVTRLIDAARGGDRLAADELLPLVYDELRQLAAAQLAREGPHAAMDTTSLVHQAYLRLVRPGAQDPGWEGRAHFLGAAAEAMRCLLVEAARRRGRLRHGGGMARVPLDDVVAASAVPPEELLAVDEALGRLDAIHPDAARLVKLRYFAGLTMAEAAEALGVSKRAAERTWSYARAWLRREIGDAPPA